MISFDRVCLRNGDSVVLDDFSLDVQQGETVLLSGRSGIGKSSILKLVLGLMQPDRGSVSFAGTPVNGHSAWNVRRRAAYVSQDFNLGEGRAIDIFRTVCGYRANHHVKLSEEQLQTLCEQLELPRSLLDKDLDLLSGGEKQRVAIILAVILGRDIFLLDEITSALDKELKHTVSHFFVGHPEWTILAVSHDPDWSAAPNVRVVEL